MPSDAGVRADHVVPCTATNRAAVLLIETDSISLIGPIRRGSFTSVKDLRDKLLNFIDYFNRVFAHPFRWTYTGRPLMAKPAA